MSVRKLLVAVVVLGLGVSVWGSTPRYGGTLRYAMYGEPPTLDMHVTTSVLSSVVAHHIFEGLFDFGADYTPKPVLLESFEYQEEGTVVVFHLRKGVLFHNGKEMTAEDVVASLQRWGQYGAQAKQLWGHVLSIEGLDPYTVVLKLRQPFGPLPAYLANIYGGPRVYPKEVAEAAGPQPIAPAQYIGTGPYRFVEWLPGRQIRLARFEGYVSPPGEPDGFTGRRVAYIAELVFVPVPDAMTRVAGVQAGDYDYADSIPTDLYDMLAAAPNVVPLLLTNPPIYPAMVFNMKQGVMANQLMRQAVLAALDMEPALRAAYGDERFWSLESSYFAKGIIWHTAVGTWAYNQRNPDKARRLAAQAGYNGEPIRFMVTTDYKHHYDQALVLTEQLRAAGFNVDLQVYDWATLLGRRPKPELWDIFFSHFLTVPDPCLVLFLPGTYVGWWQEPVKDALVDLMNRVTAFEERYAVWSTIQILIWEQVPFIKIGDAYFLDIMSTRVQGFGAPHHPLMIIPYFWNLWLEG
ncbi:ABC transporter substrate-binding protein [Candidatus Bipolaricaulota bacterium]|nr:ABC transporter substrate-binding protein [Candidatus Bipolaricaulota bacterium]